jgi:hypothetical protein
VKFSNEIEELLRGDDYNSTIILRGSQTVREPSPRKTAY